ncbi:MAG: penicillin-binding protein activator [Gammaproteobacteria bacterium]
MFVIPPPRVPDGVRCLVLALVAVITCACAPQGKPRTAVPQVDPAVAAKRQLDAGNFSAAATAYTALAAQSTGGGAARYQGLAALAFQGAGDSERADAILAAAGAADADAALGTAKACSMLATGFAEEAFTIASDVSAGELDGYARGRRAECLGRAALATGRFEAAADALTGRWRDPLPEAERAALADATWAAVSRLPGAALAAGSAATDGRVAGWYELGVIASTSLSDPTAFAERSAAWQASRPAHPAALLLERLREQSEAMSEQPRKVALLLPFDAQLGAAAAAVRDGFLTAWYLDPRTQTRPEVAVYSSAEGSVTAAARRAVDDGADLLVGPLRKAAVTELRAATDGTVKILALNVVDTSGQAARPGFYQFGLTPDGEARQVARRARQEASRAMLLAPDTDWGRRLAAAYRETWESLGGEIVAESSFGSDAQAYADAVRRGLAIDRSEARMAALRRTLNLPLHFEPRRRQDVDAVLLAAFADDARQLLPQLRYFGAGEVPVYATSHVYAGGTRLARDTDFDGIIFGDMPWLFGAADTASFNVVRRHFGDKAASGGLARLYGFGIDAYRVIPYLAKLRHQSGLRVPGVTGDLWMDSNGVLHRNMAWLRFVNGLPQLLDAAPLERGR